MNENTKKVIVLLLLFFIFYGFLVFAFNKISELNEKGLQEERKDINDLKDSCIFVSEDHYTLNCQRYSYNNRYYCLENFKEYQNKCSEVNS